MERFDWYNNHRVSESRFRAMSNGGTWGDWSRWNADTLSDPDTFLRPFRAMSEEDPASNITISGVEDLEDRTPDVIDGFVLYSGRFGMEWRKRSVYPGLYDNIERLRAEITGDPHSAQSPPEMISTDYVLDALQMILCHDRGERDRNAPEGHCRHGVYVGGCGIDRMCGACEDGAE